MIYDLIGRDGKRIAWLQSRPAHCDRGRWVAGFDVAFWMSNSDWQQRYYFDLARGQAEVLEYLKAKKVDVDGAVWKESA